MLAFTLCSVVSSVAVALLYNPVRLSNSQRVRLVVYSIQILDELDHSDPKFVNSLQNFVQVFIFL